MSDIASTKVKCFGPLPNFQAQRAGNVLGIKQNNGVRAEF